MRRPKLCLIVSLKLVFRLIQYSRLFEDRLQKILPKPSLPESENSSENSSENFSQVFDLFVKESNNRVFLEIIFRDSNIAFICWNMVGCIFQLNYEASSGQIPISADIQLRLICFVSPGTSGTISNNYILLLLQTLCPGTEPPDVSSLFSDCDYGCVHQQGIIWLNWHWFLLEGYKQQYCCQPAV